MTRIKSTIMARGKRKVCRIFDMGPEGVFDRYTIAFKGYRVEGYGLIYPYLGSSDDPFHPGGGVMECTVRVKSLLRVSV